MNTPIRKIGMENGRAVYLLNGRETTLERGLNPTQIYLGSSKDAATGEITENFLFNRSQRRGNMQKSRRKANFGKHTRKQVVANKTQSKVIYHVRKAFL